MTSLVALDRATPRVMRGVSRNLLQRLGSPTWASLAISTIVYDVWIMSRAIVAEPGWTGFGSGVGAFIAIADFRGRPDRFPRIGTLPPSRDCHRADIWVNPEG